MEHYDFIAIGDTVTDAFIRLKDAEAHCDIDNTACKLCVRFGDKVPFESVEELRAVGNSANAAVSASRLGMKTALISDLGNDTHGKEAVEELKHNNIDTTYVRLHDGLKTNYHYVLWYDVERTILIKHTEFPYVFPQNLPEPRMIYLSSLGNNSEEYHTQIAAYISEHPNVQLVFQPGTFQIKLGTTALADIYKHTHIFFCNVEEAQRILGTTDKNIKNLAASLHALGPKIVCITDGIKGAYASDGSQVWFMPVYPHDPYERTGAGDAFASTFSVAILKGKTIPEALSWGPINSMSVVQFVGAQKGLLTEEKLLEHLQNAPHDYKPTIVM